MIRAADFHRLGIEALVPRPQSEAAVRRAISAFYYGLFHRLAEECSRHFRAGGDRLVARTARALDHAVMRKACEAFARSRTSPRAPPYDLLLPGGPDPRVLDVADAFLQLQSARHMCDYDLQADVQPRFGLEMMELAEYARWKLDELHGTPELSTFLAALLLADRWHRRG